MTNNKTRLPALLRRTAFRTASLYLPKMKTKQHVPKQKQNLRFGKTGVSLVFVSVVLFQKRVVAWHANEKLSTTATCVSTCRPPCALQKFQLDSEKSETSSHHLTSQHRPTMFTSRTWQRLTKEPRRKRTGHRHGKQKNSSKPSRRDNRSTQGPHPPIRNKRTVQSENCRKVQRPSVGANWIPGGHLRFQRLSNSKP